MGIHKKGMKQKMSEYMYHHKSIDKRVVSINKSMMEIASLIKPKEKGKKK